jgi:hypothetical protein
VHEFLRKPFTSTDLYKRISNVALKPRGWVEAMGYVGPDRRRFNSGEFAGKRKRKADRFEMDFGGQAGVKDQAMRILATALERFDSDPMQAARAIREQAATLKALAMRPLRLKPFWPCTRSSPSRRRAQAASEEALRRRPARGARPQTSGR